MSEQENKFPSEVIDLPSKGRLYPPSSPLHSGKIDLKYMTAKEEDILTSTNLIKKGMVLDRLFESLILTKGVKPGDILTGDLNAVMVAARILGYGKEYQIKTKCGSCNNEQETSIDLTLLEETEGAADLTVNEKGHFEVTLPVSKKNITFKMLTRSDELGVQAEIDGMKKINNTVSKENTTFLRWIITSVEGETERMKIAQFVDSLLVKDAIFLRKEYKRAMPNVNFEYEFSCESCGHSARERLPIGVNFFWPDSSL